MNQRKQTREVRFIERERTVSAKRLWADFHSLFLTLFLILVASSIITVIGCFWRGITAILAASPGTPWGVFSSLFTNVGLGNFAADMSGLGLYAFSFVAGNSSVPSHERRRRSFFTAAMLLPAAMFSNLLWIVLVPKPATGSSGIVYALAGASAVFAIINLGMIRHLAARNQKISRIMLWLANPFLIVLALSDISLQITNARILIVGEGVNVLVHFSSFILGLVTALMWYLFLKLSLMLKVQNQ